MDISKISGQEKRVRCFLAISRAYPSKTIFVAARTRNEARALGTEYLDKLVRCEVSYYGMKAIRFTYLDWAVEDLKPHCFELDSDLFIDRVKEMVEAINQEAEDMYYKRSRRPMRARKT